MSETNLAPIHRRLDGIEHSLNQHNHRQRKLMTAQEEVVVFRGQIEEIAKSIAVPKELIKRLEAVEAAVKAVANVPALVKGLELKLKTVEGKIG